MAKWHGKLGFEIQNVEVRPGVYEPVIKEENFSGDILETDSRWQLTDNKNDNLNITNRISIILDPSTCHDFSTLKYASFMGSLWKVENVQIKYPRVIFSLGGVWNG